MAMMEDAAGPSSRPVVHGDGEDEDEEEEEGLIGWEAGREWLMSLPRRRNVTAEEIEAWLALQGDRLSPEISSVPRRFVTDYFEKQHKLMRRAEEGQPLQILDPPLRRFKQSDKWKPIWAWLESLDSNKTVGAKEITEWLSLHPDIAVELQANHTRQNLFKYVQKCSQIVVKKKRKQGLLGTPDDNSHCPNESAFAEDVNLSAAELLSSLESPREAGANVGEERQSTMPRRKRTYTATSINPPEEQNLIKRTSPSFPWGCMDLSSVPCVTEAALGKDGRSLSRMKLEDLLKQYKLLSELQIQLEIVIVKSKQQTNMPNALSTDEKSRLRNSHKRVSRNNLTKDNDVKGPSSKRKNRDAPDTSVNAWVWTEAAEGSCRDSMLVSQSRLPEETTLNQFSENCKGLITCLNDREAGLSRSFERPYQKCIGHRRRKWASTLSGWDSLEKQFDGLAIELERRLFSTWIPSWSAYTSNSAAVQPSARLDQGVQKVLDVRFHPCGAAQLVSGCNAAPNELLAYDLTSGKAAVLVGHNCQIQAVEYASEGGSIVSCASNLVKVWDSSSGTCVHTLGPGSGDGSTHGHSKKICALAVNPTRSCLIATSGGEGDSQILLWNVVTGGLVHDLNYLLRQKHPSIPSMDAMEFCQDNLLVCGSDSAYGGPAVVQIWDIDALTDCISFPANDSYITCLKSNPSGTVVLTGAGDGTVGLYDIRTCGAIGRLPLCSNCEVTSVSFSSCGRYFQASSTANNSMVWDTRIIPMEPGIRPIQCPPTISSPKLRSTRALHCLSHGRPMPTADDTSQMPGFVDIGDQGVNDARWFNHAAILVTASGNGSIAIWDVSLGQPCVRHIQSHSRCVNSVAISPDDKFICSGGDDQKLVLYQNVRYDSHQKWRLTHPLFEEFQSKIRSFDL